MLRVGGLLSAESWLTTMPPNNAFERTVEHGGPRLAAANGRWPAAQLGR